MVENVQSLQFTKEKLPEFFLSCTCEKKNSFPVCFFFSCKNLWIYLGKILLNLLLNDKNIIKLCFFFFFCLKKNCGFKLPFGRKTFLHHCFWWPKNITNSQFFKNICHWCHWNDSVTCSAEVYQCCNFLGNLFWLLRIIIGDFFQSMKF